MRGTLRDLSFPDSELVDLLTQGDERAFSEIYQRYFGLLYLHAYKILGNEEDVKDILQDLFTTIWIRRDNLNITGELSAYLYTSVRYKIFDTLSHKKVAARYIESLNAFAEKGVMNTDYRLRERELTALIEKGISDLPEKMRHIFELSRKENYSHREIALELNLSEQTVRTQVKNALRVLRVKLGAFIFLLATFF